MQTAIAGGGNATFFFRAHAHGRQHASTPHHANPQEEKDLPQSIQRACARVQLWRQGPFEGLSIRDRAVLAEIVRCADRKRPALPIYIRRETLAARESCSEPTITRALLRLQQLGWIERDQVKSRCRGFQVGSITLTSLGIAWLGLEEPLASSEKNLCESPVIDASDIPDIQCIHRQPPAVGSFVNRSENPRVLKVPESVAWLEQLGISRFGIFKLMGLARKRGQLLETVTSFCEGAIRRARHAFSYISSLLMLDRDWAYLAQEKAADDLRETAEQASRERLEAHSIRLKELAGRWFLSAKHQHLLTVEHGVFVAYVLAENGKRGIRVGAVPNFLRVFDAIDAGRIVEWPNGGGV